MTVKIVSNIPYLKELSGEYSIEQQLSVKAFLGSLNVKWDQDALVVLNGKISTGEEKLQDKDVIHLLIPIAGG